VSKSGAQGCIAEGLNPLQISVKFRVFEGLNKTSDTDSCLLCRVAF